MIESVVKMTNEQMREVICSTKPCDKLKITFVNSNFNGDLKGRLYFILAMSPPTGNAIKISEVAFWTLKAVADSGKWEGFRIYTIEILDGFDPNYFAERTISRGLLERIERI